MPKEEAWLMNQILSTPESMSVEKSFPALYATAFTHPAIDNHAHPLLRAEMRHKIPFEGVISEAEGRALLEDAPHTLACFRATKLLARLYGLGKDNVTWEDIKGYRATLNYTDLCNLCFKESGIECILLDDGLAGTESLAEEYKWHDKFINGRTKKIVRIEVVAEVILRDLLSKQSEQDVGKLLEEFEAQLKSALHKNGMDPEVVGFKSIICYRSGMDVSLMGRPKDKEVALEDIRKVFDKSRKVRLAHKALNDEVVRIGLEVAGHYGKPVQFHTGLGDNDITLLLSSPAHLQPIIKAYPDTVFVLLHSSYPYMREAGYLTSVYKNVYLDFGEVFPMVSAEGQRSVIRQVLELCPTNKIMWSSDGHWWPESYFLGIHQAREVLFEVLADTIRRQELSERDAVCIVERALYGNATTLYRLV